MRTLVQMGTLGKRIKFKILNTPLSALSIGSLLMRIFNATCKQYMTYQ